MLHYILWCWHFPLENVHAEHFPKENVQQTKMLESGKMLCFLLCKKQRLCKNAVFFALQKTKMLCKNAFDAYILCTKCSHQMHLMQKCIFATHQQNVTNAFDAYILFCKNAVFFALQKTFDAYILLVQKCIFAKQNVTNAFDAYILLHKMLQMHLMPKCILAYIFQRKMFSKRTFEMFSVHFPKENVQLCKNAFDAKMLCFLLCKKQRCCAKMHFCITFCWCKNAFLHKQNVTNAFLQYIFQSKMFSVHFPKENVQHHIFQRKMFSIHLTKCYKCIWKCTCCTKCIFATNAFDAKMHFCVHFPK